MDTNIKSSLMYISSKPYFIYPKQENQLSYITYDEYTYKERWLVQSNVNIHDISLYLPEFTELWPNLRLWKLFWDIRMGSWTSK